MFGHAEYYEPAEYLAPETRKWLRAFHRRKEAQEREDAIMYISAALIVLMAGTWFRILEAIMS